MRMRVSLIVSCAATAFFLGAFPAGAADLPPEPPIFEEPPAYYPPPPLFEVAERSCMYVRVDGGYSFNERPKVSKHHGIAFGENVDDSWFVEGGLGCRITPYLRADITVGYRTGMRLSTDFNDLDADFSAVTGMVNAYWDIATFGAFTPYVGVGLGASANILSDVNLPVGQEGNTRIDFAYSLMAGFSYDINERLTLDAGYRYIDLGTAKASGADPIKYANVISHDVRVGLRYNFE